MREKLKQYIERLFAQAPRTQSAQELKEEMLQNLLDKYDDLIREGKSEDDAYAAAIAGIGDVSGLMAGLTSQADTASAQRAQFTESKPVQKNAGILAVAIALYVLCVIPNFLFGNVFGVVMMFAFIAVATTMLIMNRTVVHPTRATLVGVGVALLIMSPVSVMLISGVLGVTLLFVMLGAGVGLIVYGRTNRFDTLPSESEETVDAGSAKLARSTKIGYAVLGAMVLVSLLGAALYTSNRYEPAVVVGLNGEVIGGADGSTQIVIDEDFDERYEDAIEEKIGSAVEGALTKPGEKNDHDDNDDHDDHDDEDDKKDGNSGKKKATAPAAVMEGATEVPAAAINEIEVDWVGGTVQVSSYDGDTIAISETGAKELTDKQKLRCFVKGNKLSISYCEETLLLWDWLDIDKLSMPAKTLTLQLPAGAIPEMEINGVSAEIDINGINFDDLDVESISGAITVTDVSGRELHTHTTSGKTKISGANVTKLDMETTSGEIEATATRADEVDVETVSARTAIALTAAPRELDVETISGKTTLTLPKDATGFSIRMETVSGDLACGFASVQQNGLYVVGSGANQYEFTSVSGDLKIDAGQ